MQITIDTMTLTDEDRVILTKVLEVTSGEKPAPEEPAPAKKAASKPPAKKAAAKPEPEPEEDVEDVEEDVEDDLLGDGDEDEDEAPTLESVTATARKLLTTGQQSKVKEALAAVGAGKVSELTPKQIKPFAEALA